MRPAPPIAGFRPTRGTISPSSNDELTWDDPSVDRLAAAERDLLGKYWLHRARSEKRVSYAFEILAAELASIGASPVVLEMLDASIDDERRHSELCRRLATRYAGEELAIDAVEAPVLPAFEGTDPELRAALRVTAMCCINETIATVWLKACFDRSREPLARGANRLHLREEMNHARLGWAHLASPFVTTKMKSAIAARLPRLLRANVPQWFEDAVELPAQGFPDHGVLPAEETKRVVLAAVEGVVLPGFAEVGIDVAPARAWA
jgi:hypothetical protein